MANADLELKDVLPDLLFASIQRHIRKGVAHGERGWDSGSEEEDTLTGDLGSALRKSQTTVNVQGQKWRWSVSYKKFRSKGQKAEEASLGSDGIFQIEVANQERVFTKGILFQAKKVNDRRHQKLLEQATNMELLAPSGSAIFQYGPDGYRAVQSAKLLTNQSETVEHTLQSYLANDFMNCSVGLKGMYFDATRHRLILPHSNMDISSFNTKHRMKIEVVRVD